MPSFIQPSFAKGELAPSLYGRVDIAAYQVGLRTARNVIIHAYGGVSNRPGLSFIGPVKDHSYAPRLIDFQYNVEDTYILEFGDEYMRVIRNDGHVLETDVDGNATADVISGATQADPVVVTVPSGVASEYSTGEEVFIDEVVGMTELNGRRFRVTAVGATTLTLGDQVDGSDIDGSGYTAYSSGGTVSRVYEIATPYAAADLMELKFVQSADIMTITHPSYPPRELTRVDHDDWTLAEITFEPAIAFPGALSLTVNTTGAEAVRYQVTATAEDTLEESLPAVVASQNLSGISYANPAVATCTAHGYLDGEEVYIETDFMPEVNGRRFFVANKTTNTFQLKGEDSTNHTTVSGGGVFGTVAATFVKASNSAATTDNTIGWAEVPGASRYAVYKEDNGLFGFIGETQDLEFTDDFIEPDLSTSPPNARNPFLLTGSYPGAAGFYEQRRIFGGSVRRPDTWFASQIASFSNMNVSVPGQQDDAITATLNAQRVNEIRHFVGTNDLIVLTSGSEWEVNSGSDVAFAADTIRQKPQSTWGASHNIPILIGNTILMVQENRGAVRSVGYNFQRDAYLSADLNTLSNHMFFDYQITDWCFGRYPDPIAYIVREDGKLVTMTFEQDQEVLAWTTWDTDGKFERCASMRPSIADRDDATYFVTKRTLNGATFRSVERTADRRFQSVEDCFFVDCGLTYDTSVAIEGITSADPVVVTTEAAHGFSNGDEVDLSDIEWATTFDEFFSVVDPDHANGGRFTVANVTSDTFELSGVDGSEWSAYVEGGAARKAVATFSGARHLTGKSVVVLADGNVVSNVTVDADGEFTLPRKASRVHIGLRYVADVGTLDIESPSGTVQGKKKKIPSIVVRMEKSRGLLVGADASSMVEVKQRDTEAMGEPTQLLTGDVEVALMPHWNSNGRVLLRQPYPLPMTVLAIIPDIQVEDDE